METQCEQFHDEMVSLLYPDEAKSLELEVHFSACFACQESLKELQKVRGVYQKLPDVFPSSSLSEKVLAKMTPQRSFTDILRALLLHPASVGLTVFCLTLGGSLFYQRFLSKPEGISQAPSLSHSTPLASGGSNTAMPLSQEVAYQPGGYRMVGWQPQARLIEDLDRPVLRHADVASMEQASIEAVASFKHQLAMRHILDGEYEQADRILDSITDNYLNYSHWEQAVLQHMRLMKKMGRENEMKRDLARLHEYALATPDVIRQAEMEFNH